MQKTPQSLSGKLEKELNYRIISLRNLKTNQFKDNKVVSYRYSLISLVLVTLNQEFYNLSYFWFLAIGGLQLSDYCEYKSLK